MGDPGAPIYPLSHSISTGEYSHTCSVLGVEMKKMIQGIITKSTFK